jgi:hypothetical protein
MMLADSTLKALNTKCERTLQDSTLKPLTPSVNAPQGFEIANNWFAAFKSLLHIG